MIVVYLDTQDTILLKSKDISFHVLYYVMVTMNKDENKWYADKVSKKDICDKLEISNISLEKILASLIERNLIFRYKRGLYGLNLDIFTT